MAGLGFASLGLPFETLGQELPGGSPKTTEPSYPCQWRAPCKGVVWRSDRQLSILTSCPDPPKFQKKPDVKNHKQNKPFKAI